MGYAHTAMLPYFRQAKETSVMTYAWQQNTSWRADWAGHSVQQGNIGLFEYNII
jgi:hypothetical protein